MEEDNVNISSPNVSPTPSRENAHPSQENHEISFNALSVDEEECFEEQGKGGEIIPFYFDQESSRSSLVKMIIMHEYPLSTESHNEMRTFSSHLQPLFQYPSLKEIKRDIVQVYKEEKLKLTKALDQNRSRVAITTEMWTSDEGKGYMVVTAHYIDRSWNLQSHLLSCAYVLYTYVLDTYVPSGIREELSDTLMKILLDWNIDRKLSAITWDNFSTDNTLKHEFLGRLDGGYLLLRGKLLHMRCCAYMVHLIVKDGLDIIKESLEKIRNNALYWSETAQRRQTFVTWCAKSGVPFSRKLVADWPNKWKSTYKMLETACLYKDVFPCLRQQEPEYTSVLSDEEWELAIDICDRLKVFYDATQLFSRTQYPTADLYFIKICKMKLALDEWITSPNPLIRQMACNMMTKFGKYWDDVLDILSVAVVLDPRYKMHLIEYYFSKLYPVDYSKQVERIQQLCYDFTNEYQPKKSSSSSSVDEPSMEEDEVDSGDHLSDFDLYVREKKKAMVSPLSTELDYYLAEDVVPRYHGFDILVWWKTKGVKYPTLQKVARDLLAIPMANVPFMKSDYTVSERMISPHLSLMGDKSVDILMCTRNWLWVSEMKDGNVSLNDFSTSDDDDDDD